MHLWTVVRVLQHTAPVQKSQQNNDQLNLSSEDSLSAASLPDDEGEDGMGDLDQDEHPTLEMANLFKIQQRDPVPEGFKRTPELHAHSNPRLTLVFLAYERPVADVTKNQTLINVSHIAHKFSQSC